jgi:ankyrin repeat protein
MVLVDLKEDTADKLSYFLTFRESEGDIDRADGHGLTMLMWAAAYGQTPTVQLLINRGASVHSR